MKIQTPKLVLLFFFVASAELWSSKAGGQETVQFTGIRLLTNREIGLTLNATNGINYRVDTSSNLAVWQGLVTLPRSTTTSLQYTDSAAPFLSARLYRAQQVDGTNVFTGDHLVTTNGDVIMQPRYHASLVMNWNGLMIYCDPADPATFTGLAKADMLLVTHSHSDHFSTAMIDSVRTTNTVLIVPQDVYNQLTAVQKPLARVMRYGDVTNVLGITIQAVPAYNTGSSPFHPFNFGNGYVVTLGGKRIYLSGDTSYIPEMKQLTDIDVAYLCMNQPYTMTVSDATNAVTDFLPKVVYPYHYRDQSGNAANAANFKQRLSSALGIEVRLRKWY